MIEFFVDCIFPSTTAQMKRYSGKTGHYFHSKEQKAAINTIAAILAPHRPEQPISGPVSVEIVITWPWLGRHSKKVREKLAVPHTSRPDLDNIVKQLIDELVKWRFIDTDACVWHLDARKWNGEKPGVYVRIDSYGGSIDHAPKSNQTPRQ